MTRHMGADAWRRLVLELEKSGQTHQEFAAAKAVSMSTLQFWLYKLTREARRASAPPVRLPVGIVDSAARSAQRGGPPAGGAPGLLEAELVSGFVVRFPAGTDVAYLRAVLVGLG
ncbi:IS66 family insertion sequence element accessory protein TnpA [Myxococcus landrumensis]|uniref:IS66 family insertion sequence element accessory protein TnpB n=1 Tax=Myxococcus landrumensis TaxID=2813577 RepID=A0ABX7NEC1_9BACT|nr:IS66 family insertion sequence element accessory protein TnpB [Myxococcus landrumus]QSQ17160.1 IS66 family insertion sequence element accessory protein TnpB [Myxococcus landrumus]